MRSRKRKNNVLYRNHPFLKTRSNQLNQVKNQDDKSGKLYLTNDNAFKDV
jgi:hypothetical protein